MSKVESRYPEVTVITPTYNELENLELVVRRICRSLEGVRHELIIVDDNSPDGTGELADELARKLPNLRVLHRKQRGLASAVVHGILHARAPIICVIDADLQHPPEKIPELLKEIENGADVAIASMYLKKGAVEMRGRWRKLVSMGARFLSRVAFPQVVRGLTDPLSGFFSFKREVVRDSKLDPVGFKILLEILVKGNWKKAVEVPYVPQKRIHGKSKLDLREYLDYLRHLVRLSRLARRREFRGSGKSFQFQ